MKNFIFLLCIFLILFGTYTGIRGSSASSTKVFNLVALGDSITHGIGDPAKKGYIGGVKVKLEDIQNTPVNVSNFAIPRYSSDKVIEQLQDKKTNAQIEKANYIILYIGTNDFRQSANHQFYPLDVKKVNEGKGKFKTNLYKILEHIRIKNSAAPIFVLGLYHPYVEYPNQQEILNTIENWNDEIDNVAVDFEKTYYVPTLDLFQDKPKSTYFSDSLHPNPAGYQLIADRVSEKVVKELSFKNHPIRKHSGRKL
ncbi:GDSL-type esterase/lipase family protein [Neobacillus sp. CF12]|uniref:GDSL-type esterase/lipase family protein n=1 Tax=Neobacillus sp. CF12 TaxID=3055864 RepID=UPI0025A06341|nr:GDSL-type esterase/lipase family protein [Neobacillus sp. CF12]MDM5328813.1 GDSL-type esterase/lipase family protein [Neobacillus sp. CF12]